MTLTPPIVKNFKDVYAYGTKQGWSFEKMCLAYERRGNGFKTNTKKAHMSSLDLVIELMNVGAFTPLMRNDRDVDLACVQEWSSKPNSDDISINSYNMRVISPLAKARASHTNDETDETYWYADFETYSQEVEFKVVKTKREVPFMVCLQSEDGSIRKTFTGLAQRERSGEGFTRTASERGSDCAEQLMEFLPIKSIVYFHNLGFDGRLLMKYNTISNIMKGSKIICQKQSYKGKRITFNDSYSLLPQALRTFPASFKKEFAGLNIQKELFPYRYYNYARVSAALNGDHGIIADVGADEQPVWTDAQKQEFISNCDKIGAKRNGERFDMIKYCEFYCQQDVNVLRIGFNAFRSSAIKPPIEIDIHTVKTAPSLANEYLLRKQKIVVSNY